MAYQADHLTKNKILEVLGPEQLFRLELLFLCLLIVVLVAYSGAHSWQSIV